MLLGILNRFRFLLVVVLAAYGGLVAEGAERPVAPRLLPEKTLVCLRITDSRELVTKFNETAMGRMLADEQMKPLATKLYGTMAELFGQVQDRVGASLDQILAIPQGEICFAVVPVPDGPPAIVLMIEVGDKLPVAQKLLDRAAEELEKNGATKTTEAIGDTKINIYDPPGSNPPAIAQFEKDGVIVLSTQISAAKQVLEFWNGQQAKEVYSLADNRKYTSIMSRCAGGKDERPHISWYADPIELVRTVGRGNSAAATGLALLPALGLDGLLGAGGSMTLIAGEFEAIQHMHLLLENPRGGALKLLQMSTGDSTPEPWVPHDAATYMTFHWDVSETFKELTKLYDSFQGDGQLASQIKQRINDPLGMDIEKELIDAVDGRFTYVTWFEKPSKLNSQSQMIAVKLKDAAVFRTTMDRVIGKFANRFDKRAFGGVSYYYAKIDRPQPPQGEGAGGQRVQMDLRFPEPCLAILGDYFVALDSEKLLQQCVVSQSDATKSLANELDFKLVASKISRHAPGTKPGFIIFNRPEEGLRSIYEVVNAANTREALSSRAGNNQFFKGLNDALQEHPLPPFSVLSQYLAPAGGMVTNDETGFHYMGFSLKRK